MSNELTTVADVAVDDDKKIKIMMIIIIVTMHCAALHLIMVGIRRNRQVSNFNQSNHNYIVATYT